jgi:hypothetical protein
MCVGIYVRVARTTACSCGPRCTFLNPWQPERTETTSMKQSGTVQCPVFSICIYVLLPVKKIVHRIRDISLNHSVRRGITVYKFQSPFVGIGPPPPHTQARVSPCFDPKGMRSNTRLRVREWAGGCTYKLNCLNLFYKIPIPCFSK